MKGSPRVSFLRIHRAALLVSVLLVASIAVSVYFGSFRSRMVTRAVTTSWPFEFSTSIERNNFQQFQQGIYDNVSITMTLRNIGNKTISVAWDSYYSIGRKIMLFDVLITGSNDAYVYQLSHVHHQTGSHVSKTLEPDAELVCLLVWQQWTDDPSHPFAEKGTYFMKGLTRGMEVTMDGVKQTIELQTPSISFTIK